VFICMLSNQVEEVEEKVSCLFCRCAFAFVHNTSRKNTNQANDSVINRTMCMLLTTTTTTMTSTTTTTTTAVCGSQMCQMRFMCISVSPLNDE